MWAILTFGTQRFGRIIISERFSKQKTIPPVQVGGQVGHTHSPTRKLTHTRSHTHANSHTRSHTRAFTHKGSLLLLSREHFFSSSLTLPYAGRGREIHCPKHSLQICRRFLWTVRWRVRSCQGGIGGGEGRGEGSWEREWKEEEFEM